MVWPWPILESFYFDVCSPFWGWGGGVVCIFLFSLGFRVFETYVRGENGEKREIFGF